MNIFNSQAELKEKAKLVHSLIKSNPTFKSSSVIKALLTDQSKAELHFAQQVSKELALFNLDELSLGQVQQVFARKSNGINYQVFKERTFANKLDARSFLKLTFSVGHANWLKSETIHPFPPEFEEIEVLKPWKKVWEELNISTKDRPFLVPAIPAECFEGKKFEIKQFQDWKLGERKCTTYANAGVLVYNKDKIVGSMKWYWWGRGDSFKASDFTFYLRHKNTIISALIDVRPSHALPTLGPDIEVEIYSPDEIMEEFDYIKGEFENIYFRTDEDEIY